MSEVYCFCNRLASPVYSENFGLLYECHNLHVNPWRSENVKLDKICGFHIHKNAWDSFFYGRNDVQYQELANCAFFNFTFSAHFGAQNYYSLSHPQPPNCSCGLPVTMRYVYSDEEDMENMENTQNGKLILILTCPNYYIDGARPKCAWKSLANQVLFQNSNEYTHPLRGQSETRFLDPSRQIQNSNVSINHNSDYNNHNGKSHNDERFENYNHQHYNGKNHNRHQRGHSRWDNNNGLYHRNNSSGRATNNNILLNENDADKAENRNRHQCHSYGNYHHSGWDNNISCNNQEKEENQPLEMVNNSNREQTRNKSVKNGIDSPPRLDCGIGPSRTSIGINEFSQSNEVMQVKQLKDEMNHILSMIEHYRSEYISQQRFRRCNQKKIIELQSQFAEVTNKLGELHAMKKKNSIMDCKVCFNKKATRALTPCYHLALCDSCVQGISKCVICGKPKEKVMIIYCS